MKILHVGGNLCGGAGEHVLSLVKGCDPRRFEPTVAMADNSPMLPDFRRAGIRVQLLALDHSGGLRRNIKAFRQLAKVLRREPFDIIHTHTSVAGALGRVAARMFTRAPTVHMLHAFAAHPHQCPPLRTAALFVERRLDRWTDWYIAGSRAMVERGMSLRIFTSNKVVMIHNGIDLARFDRVVEGASTQPRRPSSNGHSTVTIGFLGRLQKQKGVAYLIRAAAIVHAQNRYVRFVIAGDGRLRPQLEHLAAELRVADAIEFVGWTGDVVRFLSQIDILAMPSLWEAFGLSAGEAMAMEKPVIATHIEGLPEVVEVGRTGILVPPADPASLANAILELAADPARRSEMGKRGRARVEERFTLDRMIARHEDFYECLVGGGDVARLTAAAVSPDDVSMALSMAN